MSVTIATWNLNNRVGRVRFKPEAAEAACALGADVLVFTEYYPKDHHEKFTTDLASAGWKYQLISNQPAEVANRVLVASKIPVERDTIALPTFDAQLPSNLVPAILPSVGVRLLGIRIPYYVNARSTELSESWNWLRNAAAELSNSPAVIIGDLNVLVGSKARGGNVFEEIRKSGWTRSQPTGDGGYHMRNNKWSEIDHALVSSKCMVSKARYVSSAGAYELAGSLTALSDHSSLIIEVTVV